MNIKLTSNTLCGEDIQEVLLPQNELKVKFTSSLYSLENLYITAKNGEKEVKFKAKYPYEVDLKELLFPGRIQTEISLLSGTTPVKTWRMQDIIIKEINHQYKAIPEIEELKGAVKEITAILKKNNLM